MQKNNLNELFDGPFSQLCVDFINYKRSLGRKYISEMFGMKRFDKFTIKHNYKSNILSKDLVENFVKLHKMETQRNSMIRRILMQQFALYLSSMGHNAYIIPKLKVKTTSSFTPYIFSESEISAFFHTIDHLAARKVIPYIYLILPVVFRILYCCGLRISEALNLKISDINLDEGILTVRHAKCDTERLIPISESLNNLCKDYMTKMHKNKKSNDYFFPSHDNTNIIRQTIFYHFRKILWKSGISYRGKGIGPRLHDFRHTFAVHSLKKCVSEGKDIYTFLPILSVFLGHNSVAATQIYLRLTAESHPDIIQLTEKNTSKIFPEDKE
jgi:integrase